jgi:hypothetical protein
MVIKGKSVAGAGRLAAHLQRLDTNERMELIELRDVAATDLRGALQEMEAIASRLPQLPEAFLSRLDQHARRRASDAGTAHGVD